MTSSFVHLEQMVDDEIPLTTLKPVAGGLNRDILIIYGGSTKPEFRKVVKQSWSEELAHRGFTVHCFDFRSNIPGNDFERFGLFDRFRDTGQVMRWLKNQPHRNPLTIVGVSMGGFIAVYMAAAWKNVLDIAKLILVAPAAYHNAAFWPEIKFGKGTKNKPRLNNILNDKTKPYIHSGVFGIAEGGGITTDTLIISYQDDQVVKEIPGIFYAKLYLGKLEKMWKFGPSETVTPDSPKIITKILSGGHAGTFEDQERVSLLLSHFVDFIMS